MQDGTGNKNFRTTGIFQRTPFFLTSQQFLSLCIVQQFSVSLIGTSSFDGQHLWLKAQQLCAVSPPFKIGADMLVYSCIEWQCWALVQHCKVLRHCLAEPFSPIFTQQTTLHLADIIGRRPWSACEVHEEKKKEEQKPLKISAKFVLVVISN